MKNRSLRFRINLWYTLLIGTLCTLLIVFINFAGINAQRAESQQKLISSVEGNIDEIEVEDGFLDIESDFAFFDGITSIVVFSDDGSIIGGGYPENIQIDEPLESGSFKIIEVGNAKYYIYDKKVEFHKYEYKINGITGEIISSESEGMNVVIPFEGSLEGTAPGCEITYKDALETALDYGGFKKEDITIISVSPSKYADKPIYEVEFYSIIKAHSDIWVRGVVKSGSDNGVWKSIMVISLLLTPLIMLLSAFIGGKIANAAMKPIRELNDTVSRIESGNDLTQSVHPKDSDPQVNKLAENFNRMFSRLRRSFENEKQFTSDASHELRTPIAVILAECDYQLTEDSLTEETKEGFDTIRSQALSMKKMISQLLSFTRLEHNSREIDFENINLSELFADLTENMKTSAKEKEISLINAIDPDITLKADMSLLLRIGENLISNAIRYGREKGEVEISLKEENNKVILKVKDNGIGIEKENLEKIWNRFYRVDKARSREEGCSGLGLPMVKQIAEIHGGRVYAESEIGKGSTFTVELPKNN